MIWGLDNPAFPFLLCHHLWGWLWDFGGREQTNIQSFQGDGCLYSLFFFRYSLTLQLWLAEYSQSNSRNPSAISSLVLESQAYPTIPDVAVSGHSNFSLYGICKLNWAQLPYHPQFLPDDSRSHQTPCLGAWAQSSDHFEKSQFEIFSGLPMPSSTDFRGFSLLDISLRLTSGCKNKK